MKIKKRIRTTYGQSRKSSNISNIRYYCFDFEQFMKNYYNQELFGLMNIFSLEEHFDKNKGKFYCCCDDLKHYIFTNHIFSEIFIHESKIIFPINKTQDMKKYNQKFWRDYPEDEMFIKRLIFGEHFLDEEGTNMFYDNTEVKNDNVNIRRAGSRIISIDVKKMINSSLKNKRRGAMVINDKDLRSSFIKKTPTKKIKVGVGKIRVLRHKGIFTNPRGKIQNISESDSDSEIPLKQIINNNNYISRRGSFLTSFLRHEKYVYHYLASLIMEGETSTFIQVYEKNKNKININKQGQDGNNLLILSVMSNNIIISRHLCERGADVNIQNGNGNTALHYAIAYHYFNIADFLKLHGAREDLINKNGLAAWELMKGKGLE